MALASVCSQPFVLIKTRTVTHRPKRILAEIPAFHQLIPAPLSVVGEVLLTNEPSVYLTEYVSPRVSGMISPNPANSTRWPSRRIEIPISPLNQRAPRTVSKKSISRRW